jgi:hypothetical protein
VAAGSAEIIAKGWGTIEAEHAGLAEGRDDRRVRRWPPASAGPGGPGAHGAHGRRTSSRSSKMRTRAPWP